MWSYKIAFVEKKVRSHHHRDYGRCFAWFVLYRTNKQIKKWNFEIYLHSRFVSFLWSLYSTNYRLLKFLLCQHFTNILRIFIIRNITTCTKWTTWCIWQIIIFINKWSNLITINRRSCSSSPNSPNRDNSTEQVDTDSIMRSKIFYRMRWKWW